MRNKVFIIAEAGNAHEGNINMAYELIWEASGCGCDAVKFQAGTAEGFARTPDKVDFYKPYVLSLEDFVDLYRYGCELGIPVFFSIWSPEYEQLWRIEKYHKIPARQCNRETIEELDGPNTFVSIPFDQAGYYKLGIKKSTVLHCVTEYPTNNPRLYVIDSLNKSFARVGYSDHTIGIDACLEAASYHNICAIEKHFTLDKRIKGLRDHELSANPADMKQLVEIIRGLK
jgi:sialic acid synthase SpsE